MRLYAPGIAQEAKPGQFVHVRVRDGYDPLLRRPFSIYKSKDERIEIFYKVVGSGTKLLSKKKTGNKIDILGPLGQGFKISPNLKRIVLLAGGMGIAPLYFLAEELNREDILILLGAENKGKVLYLEDLKNLNVKVQIATEDGSQGYKGLLSELFFHLIKKNSQIDLVCACGPIPMLKKIAQPYAQKNSSIKPEVQNTLSGIIGTKNGLWDRGLFGMHHKGKKRISACL